MIVFLKFLIIFCVNVAVGKKTNDEVKNMKRFGSILIDDPMEVILNPPILASITRVNSNLEPVSLPYLAHINPNFESLIQPAFTFSEPVQPSPQLPLFNQNYQEPIRTDGFSMLNYQNTYYGEVNDNDYSVDETDQDSDYFSSNINYPIVEEDDYDEYENGSDEQENGEDDYFVSNDKVPIKEEENSKKPKNKPGNSKNPKNKQLKGKPHKKKPLKGKIPKTKLGKVKDSNKNLGKTKVSDKKVNFKSPADEIDNYVDHKDIDEFYDDEEEHVEKKNLLRISETTSVDDTENENKLKCDNIICPSKTYSCESTIEAISPDFIKIKIITKCLSQTNEVLATKNSELDNPTSGENMFAIQTMDHEGKIKISFEIKTENDMNIENNSTNMRRNSESHQESPKYTNLLVDDFLKKYNSNQNVNEPEIKRKMGNWKHDKSPRIKGGLSRRQNEDDPPVVITKGKKEDLDNFHLRRKMESMLNTFSKKKTKETIKDKKSKKQNITPQYSRRSKKADKNHKIDDLIERKDLQCSSVECPAEAFSCRTISDAIPPDFINIQIVIECLSKDDVVLYTDTTEELNARRGTYIHSETLLNRYGELNTMSEYVMNTTKIE